MSKILNYFNSTTKSMFLKELNRRRGSRYWWHHQNGHDYLPSIYRDLSRHERRLILDWYTDTDDRFPGGAGESCIPALSIIQGFIDGNGIDTIVQCGHYHGYSSILIGILLRNMRKRHGMISMDINRDVTAYSQSWILKAGLGEYVKLVTGSSTDESMPSVARHYFGRKDINLVFIDSSHTYSQTVLELEFWFNELAPGGFLVFHDASAFAKRFCSENRGGVYEALADWRIGERGSMLWINKTSKEPFNNIDFPPYSDVCGLAVIHKNTEC